MEHRQVLLQNHHALLMAAGCAHSPPQAPSPTNTAQAKLFAASAIGHQDKAPSFCVLLTLAIEPLWEGFDAIHGDEQQVLLKRHQDFKIEPKLRQISVVQ